MYYIYAILHIYLYILMYVLHIYIYIYIYGSREKNSSLMEAKIFHLYGMDI